MKVIISCGGTGGHLSPGISLAEGLMARGHTVTLLISRKKVDARLIGKYPEMRVERMPGLPFAWHPVKFVRCAVSQLQALAFCLRLVARIRPRAIVAFGGFTSGAAVLAGKLCGAKVALHESNRIPGLATRGLARVASRVYLPAGVRLGGVAPARVRHVGLPVRGEIMRVPRAEARAALGLDPNQKVLSILGGSQGASALNEWARSHIPALAAKGVQVYCLTGLDKAEPEILRLKSRNGTAVTAVFAPFCDCMAELLSASDLVVSRAGAGTLAELIRCETPAILVPYPHAADDHQRANAGFFERQGGGLVVEQNRMDRLEQEVMDTIFNDWLLRKFRANLRRMDRTNALEVMVRDIEELGGDMTGGYGERALA
jgi:UDP-N-acetylglucosamine--N-acetylmuramyl-(pentapeptide) pyrophosphoryl-undecaprenol N-acetylglucosamine transferase